MKKIGFLVNPIAGMGGRVGLKGTDGMVEEAARRGAVPVAGGRAREAMSGIEKHAKILTCSSVMGEYYLEENSGKNVEIVYDVSDKTSADDTKNACRKFLDEEADAIVFCGGDGTARDVLSVVGKRVPILGIPAGVKMHSSVFAVTPNAANRIITKFLQGDVSLVETEVIDIDEASFRRDDMKIKLYGYAISPYEKILMQMGKEIYVAGEEVFKEGIASFLSLVMRKGTYILGGGSTTGRIADELGIENTLLGVDVVKDGKLIVKDAGEDEILRNLDGGKNRIIVSPIGRQGFVFGRGNQQISPGVIEAVGAENIIIVSTPYKLSRTPYLFVDTGSDTLNKKLSGWKSVITGFGMAERKKVMSI